MDDDSVLQWDNLNEFLEWDNKNLLAWAFLRHESWLMTRHNQNSLYGHNLIGLLVFQKSDRSINMPNYWICEGRYVILWTTVLFINNKKA